MTILELRILPPIAIGRLGDSPTPLEAFDLVASEEKPLDYRHIAPRQTFTVDKNSGAITHAHVPDSIRFKEPDGSVRPVAPFLEIFARTDTHPDELVPLTLDLLTREGLSLADLSWSAEVGNIKLFRRTGKIDDKIIASLVAIHDHRSHPLLGLCANFLPGKSLHLGEIQFIKPNAEFPQIRLRYTPATGKVYGSGWIDAHGNIEPRSYLRKTSTPPEQKDPVIDRPELVLYDAGKGGWRGYVESDGPALTNPGQIFAGYNRDDGARVSWGYLDDECDGVVTVQLKLKSSQILSAHAHISAGPPAYAPDTLPIRVVSDELEQILFGPEIEGEVPIEEAEAIVFRALETVRLMNTSVMNGNAIDARSNVVSTMVRQDTNDFGRYYGPIMASSLVDNLSVLALHERIFTALRTGQAPWFPAALRQPDEIGDLSDEGRRKMPALMRGADGRALCLTHRQINMIIQAATKALFQPAEAQASHAHD